MTDPPHLAGHLMVLDQEDGKISQHTDGVSIISDLDHFSSTHLCSAAPITPIFCPTSTLVWLLTQPLGITTLHLSPESLPSGNHVVNLEL
jgi:hypothetical protein